MQLNNKFSWKTAIFMAKLAKHAYNSQAAFKKTFKKDWKIKMFSQAVLNVMYSLVQKTIL